jgi:hypothetical protein
MRAVVGYAAMALATAAGVATFMFADVQLALTSIDPNDSSTWPDMAPQVRYFFIPVVAGAIVIVAIVANLLLSLIDGRRMGLVTHWLLLGAAYSLVASALPMRYLGLNVPIALAVGVVLALACVLLIRWRYGVRAEAVAV